LDERDLVDKVIKIDEIEIKVKNNKMCVVCSECGERMEKIDTNGLQTTLKCDCGLEVKLSF